MRIIFKKLLGIISHSIKLKIILIYVLSLIIVYVVTWWVLSVFLFQPLEVKRAQNMIYNSEKIVSDIRSIRENYDNILYRLSNNRNIYKSLSNKNENYEGVWEALTSIKYTLSEDMGRSTIIKKLAVYQQGSDIGQDGKYVFSDGFDREKLNKTNWANETIDGSVLLCKYQKVSALYNNVEAYIRIAIKSQEAFGAATEIEREMSGTAYLTDGENRIIATSVKDSLGDDIQEILPENLSEFAEGKVKQIGKTMILKCSVDENWHVWLLISSNQFGDKLNHSKIIAGIILLGYGICSAIILSLSLSRIFNRLNKLGEKMEQIKGDISYIQIPEKYDEVSALEIRYNSMLNKLGNVIDEMAEVKSLKQKFEFKCLESQINPHFLYNTLGVMRWEALGSENQKLVSMIDDLTTFYRLSLNKGKGLLTVHQELILIEAYINIQQLRWDHVVDVTISMDPDLEEVIIPKMILQPLVENIWLHGNITSHSNRKVEISAINKGSRVEFRIWDNGDGISQDLIDKFKINDSATQDTFGIGIQFIRNILRHYYGMDYVCELSSEKSSGTLVRIELPKEMDVII